MTIANKFGAYNKQKVAAIKYYYFWKATNFMTDISSMEYPPATLSCPWRWEKSMPSQASRIALVFDRDFGGKLHKLAATQPVWICNSAINRSAAQSLWDEGLTSGEVTLFQMMSADPAEAFSQTVEMIGQHHPNWSQLQVIGIAPTEPIKAVVLTHSGGSIETAENGFVVKRDIG